MTKITGRCQCGQVKFAAATPPDRVGVCHCLDCRRHHGALFYAAAIYQNDAVKVSGETSSHDGRHWCQNCGSSVFARSGNEIELHLGAMDNADAFRPTYETWVIRRAIWVSPVEGATQYERNR
ncbi:MAG: GFA family protein [Pseudomonadota bacterium]